MVGFQPHNLVFQLRGARRKGFISWRLHDDVAWRMRGEARPGIISMQGVGCEASVQSSCYAWFLCWGLCIDKGYTYVACDIIKELTYR
jgi:hypothetical protein